jgi:hypothetical protein
VHDPSVRPRRRRKNDGARGVQRDMYLVAAIVALAGCWVIVFAINK